MAAERPHIGTPRHWAGFLVSGGLAFAADWIVLEAGIRMLGLGPYPARIISIGVAMIVGWIAHRKLTFAVNAPPSVAELVRYASAAWVAAAVNYMLFVGLLLAFPWLTRFVALFSSSIGAMVFSYIAMRYAVFRTARKK